MDLCDICEFQLYNHISDLIAVMQNRINGPKFYLFQLCHLSIKAGKESFATCQGRQLAKSPLPPAEKGSRQRAFCHLSTKAVGKEFLF